MKTSTRNHQKPQAGYTLLTTLLLTGVTVAVLAATLARSYTSSKLNDRENYYVMANAAAEAATEKVLSMMTVDFAAGGEGALSNKLSYYRTSLMPTSAESSFWTNFQFSDAQGNVGATYVTRTTTNGNLPYVQLLQQYPGLNAFAANYRIISNVKYTNSNYNFIGAVQQDVQMAEIPVFQFAIFYNTLLEFSDCAPMTVNGRVHCNTNINVGCTSGSSLTFNYFVTCSGVITNPGAAGIPSSSWGTWPLANIHYNGTPSPGWGTGEAVLTLPIGTNSSDPNYVREIINPPPIGEATTNSISAQRFYNKADLIILITNALVPTNNSTNLVWCTNAASVEYTNCITVIVKNTMYDGSPTIFSVTNMSQTNIVITNGVNFAAQWSNWCKLGITNWLSTTKTFYDQRENRNLHVVQIDVGKLGTWISTTTNGVSNTNLSGKWTSSNPFDGIIYVQDMRTTVPGSGGWMNAVRLTNGVNITNGLYSSGLTVATQNPLYIAGYYNCPGDGTGGSQDNQLSTNTIGCRPCSVVCDALTILSPSWNDATSSGSTGNASDDQVNTAIIAGNVLTTDTSLTGYSGGVHNLTRLLENWSGDNLWLNTSLINLYSSVQATHQFEQPSAYYNAPTRKFSFDLNFTTAGGLPPGTPLVNRMIRATWCNPPPNTLNYAYTNDFVAR